ncbi:MAG: 2-C-methyl-D-erythritol 4-phosphate cytidylyltransferase [Candidatus Desulfofervidaceae bacterium]|nr:2-C-methyl-D-erythritol 4-phosphate cytidylyltransferase [Candidatus Desulfofervidaceae bacterium]
MVTAIIVAAGIGRRMGSELPKQFLSLKGKPILWHTLARFQKCVAVKEIVLVVNPFWEKESRMIAAEFSKIVNIVYGGGRRQESVWAGLKEVKESEIVLVHDGVRPFVSESLIETVVEGASKWGAVIPALPAKETVKWVENNIIKKTLPRHSIWLAQTPQGFKYDVLKTAYIKAQTEPLEFTDDASLVEQLGIAVRVIPGEPQNIKITTPEDLQWAESLLLRE